MHDRMKIWILYCVRVKIFLSNISYMIVASILIIWNDRYL